MSNGSKIVTRYQYVRRSALLLPIISPVLLIIANIAHKAGLCAVNPETNWILWFVRDEYIYVSEHYANNSDALYIFHDYDVIVAIVLSLCVLYTITTMVVAVSTRYSDCDVVYGTAVMLNIRQRAQTNRMTPIYRFFAKYAAVTIVGIWIVVAYRPDVHSVLFREWAEYSLVTFVMIQSIMTPLVLCFASQWFVMGAIVVVSLARRSENKNISTDTAIGRGR